MISFFFSDECTNVIISIVLNLLIVESVCAKYFYRDFIPMLQTTHCNHCTLNQKKVLLNRYFSMSLHVQIKC